MYTERLQEIENEWLDTVLDTVRQLAADHPGEQFYAGAFWLCYVDYTMFGVPCFAMNTEAHGGNTSEGIRWAPPNWRFDVIDSAVARMQPRYEALSRDLKGEGEEIWNVAIDEHFQVLARVSRKATETVHQWRVSGLLGNITDDFVIGILDEREGEPIFSELVRDSITPERLSRLSGLMWG